MTSIQRNLYECEECGKEVHIWHNVCNREGARGKYTPAKVGCPECKEYMDMKGEDSYDE